MDDTQRLAMMVEAVFYESTVSSLVEMSREAREAGGSREQILHELTAMLLKEMATPGQIASVAAMTVVMLEEERR